MSLSYGDETAFTVTPNITALLRCIFKKWSVVVNPYGLHVL